MRILEQLQLDEVPPVLAGELVDHRGTFASLMDLETEEEVWRQPFELLEEAA